MNELEAAEKRKTIIDLCDGHVLQWDSEIRRLQGVSLLPFKYDKIYFQMPSLKSLAGNSIKKQLYYKALFEYASYCYDHGHDLCYNYNCSYCPYDYEYFRLKHNCCDARNRHLDDIQEEVRRFYHE